LFRIFEVISSDLTEICGCGAYRTHSSRVPDYKQQLEYAEELVKRRLSKQKACFIVFFATQNAEAIGRFI